MATCKRCDQPIHWEKEGLRFIALNPDGSLHRSTCMAPATCSRCDQPVVWKNHDGKSKCFEPDGETPHGDVCPNRDRCHHCAGKIRWVPVEGKWLAFDAELPEMLHWTVCLKNPDAARLATQRVAEMTRELYALRSQVALLGNPNGVEGLQREVERLKKELSESREHYQRELRYRDVELARLTKKLAHEIPSNLASPRKSRRHARRSPSG